MNVFFLNYFSEYSKHKVRISFLKTFVSFRCSVSPYCQCGASLREGSLAPIRGKFWPPSSEECGTFRKNAAES